MSSSRLLFVCVAGATIRHARLKRRIRGKGPLRRYWKRLDAVDRHTRAGRRSACEMRVALAWRDVAARTTTRPNEEVDEIRIEHIAVVTGDGACRLHDHERVIRVDRRVGRIERVPAVLNSPSSLIVSGCSIDCGVHCPAFRMAASLSKVIASASRQ